MPRGILIVSLIILLLVACARPELNPPRNPQRIVSLKPTLTEMLFELGAGDRVVGVTRHCKWPEKVDKLPKVGDYAAPDIEKILSLKPDLVVTLVEASSPRLVSVLKKAGIPIVVFKTDNLTDIYRAIIEMGSIMGAPDAAKRLSFRIRSSLEGLRQKTGSAIPRKALVVVQRYPLIVAGEHTFLDEILEVSGARNVAKGGKMIAYPNISMEKLLAWQPDVIIDLDPYSSVEGWSEYRSLPAVRDKRIYFLSPNLFIPGPRVEQAAQMIAHAIYPEIIKE